ncbi:MAG: M20/M25/M40 family metallo-hydrolase [bacterium]
MKRIALFCAALAVAAYAAGPDWLAYVEYGPGESVFTVAATDATVVFELERGCLVTADEAALAGLAPTLGVRRLDANPAGKHYMYVVTLRGPLPALDEFGTVLHRAYRDEGEESVEAAVLLTDEARAERLAGLPVELARIDLQPVHISWKEAGIPPVPSVNDSLLWDLVNAVSQDTVESFIQRLQDFRTRLSTTDSCRAAIQWVAQRLEAYGCDTVFEFPFRPGYAPNAIGIRYGKLNPQRIYSIGGHADAITYTQPQLTAPGADDNASGTAAVLEAARVYQDMEFENTVYFMAFSGEEQGLYGSDSFAKYCRNRGDSIMAMLNFDMISYGRENRDSLNVYGQSSNPNATWLADFYIAHADTFTALKIRRIIRSTLDANSDHASFLKQGFHAMMAIERDFTPKYHTIGDTIGPLYYANCGTNNLPLATNTIRAAVASLARLAGASPLTGLAEGSVPSRAAGLVEVRPSVGVDGFRVRLTAPARPGSRLRVYNATGRLVRSLDIAGRAEAEWDGRDEAGRQAAAGSYLFRLTDGRRTTSLRAILTGTGRQ